MDETIMYEIAGYEPPYLTVGQFLDRQIAEAMAIVHTPKQKLPPCNGRPLREPRGDHGREHEDPDQGEAGRGGIVPDFPGQCAKGHAGSRQVRSWLVRVSTRRGSGSCWRTTGLCNGAGTERVAHAADLFRPGAVIQCGPEQRGGRRRVKEHPALAAELLCGRGERPGLVLAKHANTQHPEAGLPISEP